MHKKPFNQLSFTERCAIAEIRRENRDQNTDKDINLFYEQARQRKARLSKHVEKILKLRKKA